MLPPSLGIQKYSDLFNLPEIYLKSPFLPVSVDARLEIFKRTFILCKCVCAHYENDHNNNLVGNQGI